MIAIQNVMKGIYILTMIPIVGVTMVLATYIFAEADWLTPWRWICAANIASCITIFILSCREPAGPTIADMALEPDEPEQPDNRGRHL